MTVPILIQVRPRKSITIDGFHFSCQKMYLAWAPERAVIHGFKKQPIEKPNPKKYDYATFDNQGVDIKITQDDFEFR